LRFRSAGRRNGLRVAAAGQLVEQRDAIGVLVAKVGNPHATREVWASNSDSSRST
jgi:hypothetical protein